VIGGFLRGVIAGVTVGTAALVVLSVLSEAPPSPNPPELGANAGAPAAPVSPPLPTLPEPVAPGPEAVAAASPEPEKVPGLAATPASEAPPQVSAAPAAPPVASSATAPDALKDLPASEKAQDPALPPAAEAAGSAPSPPLRPLQPGDDGAPASAEAPVERVLDEMLLAPAAGGLASTAPEVLDPAPIPRPEAPKPAMPPVPAATPQAPEPDAAPGILPEPAPEIAATPEAEPAEVVDATPIEIEPPGEAAAGNTEVAPAEVIKGTPLETAPREVEPAGNAETAPAALSTPREIAPPGAEPAGNANAAPAGVTGATPVDPLPADIANAAEPTPEPTLEPTPEPAPEPTPGLPLDVEGVTVDRLPQIGDAAVVPDAAAPAEEVAPVDPADLPPLQRDARAFENPGQKPLFAIILIDTGEVDLDRAALAAIPFPVSFALDPLDPASPGRAELYRAAGQEVLMLATGLPDGAQASDVEVALSVMGDALPQAVAVIDTVEGAFQDDRPLATGVIPVIASQGRGVVTWDRGLNAADQVARRDGVPSAVIFRALDTEGEGSPVIRRYLDRAAFKAAQEGRVVVAGFTRPETIAALMEWAVEGRSASVALAPVTAVLSLP